MFTSQFCPVAKKMCSPSDLAMEDDCLPETSFPAVTHQPSKHQVPHMSPSLHQRQSDHTGLRVEPQQNNYQHQSNHMGPRVEPQQNKQEEGPKWLSWQGGRLASWSAVTRSCRGGDNDAQLDREGWGQGEAGHGQRGGAERLGSGSGQEALPSSPRVEIDQDSNSCWQTPQNLRKQLEVSWQCKQICFCSQEFFRILCGKSAIFQSDIWEIYCYNITRALFNFGAFQSWIAHSSCEILFTVGWLLWLKELVFTFYG